MKSVFLAISVILVVASLSFGQNLNKLNWILGEWQMVDGTTTTTESWKRLNDSTFVGKGLAQQADKVVFEEELSIEFRNGEVQYVAVLPDKIARFKLTDARAKLARFEDPKNDFPSKLLYQLVDSNMEITLYGNQHGENQSVKMTFRKK